VTIHPLYAYEDEILRKANAHTASLGDSDTREHIRILGIVNHVKHITTRKGMKMAVLVLQDLHGTVEVTIFTRLYADVSQKLEEGRVLLVGGRVEIIDENLQKIIATGIEDLTKVRVKRLKPTAEPKQATITIKDPSEETIQQIAEVITGNPGNCELNVVLHFGSFAYTLGGPATISGKALDALKALGNTRIKLQ